MPKWNDYLSAARERGSLAFEVFCIVSVPAGDPDLLQRTLPDHLAYQKELESQGVLMFAGPLSDESGENMEGMGMMIYRAPSFEAAQAVADDDPMHKAGARRYSLRRWMINEGNVSINVKLAAQTADLR
jgi:uncharacterized protein YciI